MKKYSSFSRKALIPNKLKGQKIKRFISYLIVFFKSSIITSKYKYIYKSMRKTVYFLRSLSIFVIAMMLMANANN